MEFIRYYDSPLGKITFASDGENLTGLWFENQKYYALTLGSETCMEDLPVFRDTKKWLDLYFKGEKPDFMPSLCPKGTAFQERVWKELLKIPYGETRTYGEIAAVLANEKKIEKMSARAVGGAVGHNPISILIPCHRVVGADGSLTGYAGGIERKMVLLRLENVRISKTLA